MRYFLKLAYNGADFHGWQTQPNARSVQQSIEEALSVILRAPTSITGAGRTDTGVNARMMVAHFDTTSKIEDTVRFLKGLNKLCGPHIAIEQMEEVPADAHARFDAVSRTYKYFVIFEKSPFLDSFAWHSPSPLNVEEMNRAAQLLCHTEDFTSFAKLHSDVKTNLCSVTEAGWQPWHNDYEVPGIVFTITANRFLRNMVRAVVGTLVDVGRGKLSYEDFSRIIDLKDRCKAGTSMPANALFLWRIEYPAEILKALWM